tara:strand:+ start:21315 stop:22433 length:1119 start_codon:yes stop_codon:yes gene_type:complete
MIECKICLLNETIPNISFDNQNVCSYCKKHDILDNYYKKLSSGNYFKKKIEEIKTNKLNQYYNCLIGVSGGVDSIYTLYLAHKYGLKPLIVHFDDGWNNRISVKNIRYAIEKFNFDYENYVADWDEIKSLYRSFFKASVPDAGVPGDIGIFGTLIKIAKEEKIKYIISGQNFRNEGTQPLSWSFIDGDYINIINKKYENIKLKRFPNITQLQIAKSLYIDKIEFFPILNFIDYEKSKAKIKLNKICNWEDYGGHHHENYLSIFINNYYNIEKFKINRKLITYSAQIRCGLLDKKNARDIIDNETMVDQKTIDYCIHKLGFNKEEWIEIMRREKRYYYDYRKFFKLIKKFRIIFKVLVSLKLLNPIIYYRYFG